MYQLPPKAVVVAPEKAVEQAKAREAAMRSIMVNMGYEAIEIVEPEQAEVVSWWID